MVCFYFFIHVHCSTRYSPNIRNSYHQLNIHIDDDSVVKYKNNRVLAVDVIFCINY